ncbi:MAG TPA: SpvB/TcaC N-terminal domain-containing protein, partial [Nitrososphaeraceae archaeon]|nr:SpvB/TcaC N-terminal domain-containing protein [Nitrososphaeraceae archaeon]
NYSPDLHTGTGNFTVPVVLPRGRNGFQPKIALHYSTGSGNGPFSLGWSIGLPEIHRKTSKGIPIYDDSQDVFLLTGSDDLVEVSSDVAGSTLYRPRTEGIFARIYHHKKDGSDYWEVKTKDGLVNIYGTPGPVDVEGWRDPAVISDPNDFKHIFAWKLTLTLDAFGNRIEYEYEADEIQKDGPHFWNQTYLSEIRYVDYDSQDSALKPNFLVRVRFLYDTRYDSFSEYRSGFEIRTRKRCKKIKISTHADSEKLVSTYHLSYMDEEPDILVTQQLPPNRISLLTSITVEGHDGLKYEAFPPIKFGYTKFEPKKRDFIPITGPDPPSFSLSHPTYELIDLMGDGLPGILEIDGTVRYWRNLGNGMIDRPREIIDAPNDFRLSDSGVQIIDSNGDGRPDLFVSNHGGLCGYFSIGFGGIWGINSFRRYEFAPSFDLKGDPLVKLVDLNGDGTTDAVRLGSNNLLCFFNDPDRGWKETRRVQYQSLQEFPNVNFSDPHIHWADMTGDNLQDMVLVYDGNVLYWPALGNGNWAKPVCMRNNPHFPYLYDPGRVLVGDVDGDGLADIVHVGDTSVTLWINQSGNQWSEPIVVLGTPPVSNLSSIRLADMFGTGVSGILWSKDNDGLSRENMYFLDFTGKLKPYLLNEINGNSGSVTLIGYKTSTNYFIEDSGRLETKWKTALPFPVQLVAKVEVINLFSGSKQTKEYRYHHGYWDGCEREFVGFGRVDVLDTEIFSDFHDTGLHPANRKFEAVPKKIFSAPTETRTWYHLGAVESSYQQDWEEANFTNEFWNADQQVLSNYVSIGEFLKNLNRIERRDAIRTLRGNVLRTELYGLDGTERQSRPYTVSEFLYGISFVSNNEISAEESEEEKKKIFFPHLLAERTTQWERGNEPMTQFKFTTDYDKYGQSQSHVSVAVPRGRDFTVSPNDSSEPYLVTNIMTSFAQRDDESIYIVDRISSLTTHEIMDRSNMSLFDLVHSIEHRTIAKGDRSIISQTLNFYDGDPFDGLPLGEIGKYGVLTRTENLALTEEILFNGYKTNNIIMSPTERPPYMAANGSVTWTEEYPEEYRSRIPTRAGYALHSIIHDAEHEVGYFTIERKMYDFHDNENGGKGRGLLKVSLDPLGNDTTIGYDEYELLPTDVTDAIGLTTYALNDYRVLKPKEITDPNGNKNVVSYTPLGLVESIAVIDKNGKGDTVESPSTRFEYDFLAFEREQKPIFAHTIRLMHHLNESGVPLEEKDNTIETREYSDGFGRLLQIRTQAEDVIFGDSVFGDSALSGDQSTPIQELKGRVQNQPNKPFVVVSGWQIYDNKGRVVEKYEPFFSQGWEYAHPVEHEFGQKELMYYDPRGNMIRSVLPDGSEKMVIYGVPGKISEPDVANRDNFEPTPWEVYTYDENDNAGLTHPDVAGVYRDHWNTPSHIVYDALGRTVKSVVRNGSNKSDWYTTCSTYDIRGNLLTVTDPLGRLAFSYVYDFRNNVLRSENIDSGIRRIVLDARGSEIEQRDSGGAIILNAYDPLNRPIRLWASDKTGSRITLRERLEYGDGSSRSQPIAERGANRLKNVLGRLHMHYDEAGLLVFEHYDFKGNVLENVRKVISDALVLAVFPSAENPSADWNMEPFHVDWQIGNGVIIEDAATEILDSTEYRLSSNYDALNHLKEMLQPNDIDGARRRLIPKYNRAGALEQVELDGSKYIERIAYNAKGDRIFVAYGNNLMIRYAYNPYNFRLTRVRVEHYNIETELIYKPHGEPLQDFAYEHDKVGNILTIHDRAPKSGVPNSPLGIGGLDRLFTYDPIYRLISATGRECDGEIPSDLWNDEPKCQDVNHTRNYLEEYAYDSVGNMTTLNHSAQSGGFKRQFILIPNRNRISEITMGAANYDYSYDSNGNMTKETSSRHFEWDYCDRLGAYRTQIGDSEPSVHTHYFYDSSGQRTKKLVRKKNQAEVTIYMNGIFEHHIKLKKRNIGYEIDKQYNIFYVMDAQKRIALVRAGETFDSNDTAPSTQYLFSDHLESNCLVVSATGDWISREEYSPYGESTLGGFARKRFRFNGKERDDESRLYYFGARYYAPWLGWVSCDPEGLIDDTNLYRFSKNNPLRFIDSIGTNPTDPNEIVGPPAPPPADDVEQFSMPQPSKTPQVATPKRTVSARDTAVKIGTEVLIEGADTLLKAAVVAVGVKKKWWNKEAAKKVADYVPDPIGATKEGYELSKVEEGKRTEEFFKKTLPSIALDLGGGLLLGPVGSVGFPLIYESAIEAQMVVVPKPGDRSHLLEARKKLEEQKKKTTEKKEDPPKADSDDKPKSPKSVPRRRGLVWTPSGFGSAGMKHSPMASERAMRRAH